MESNYRFIFRSTILLFLVTVMFGDVLKDENQNEEAFLRSESKWKNTAVESVIPNMRSSMLTSEKKIQMFPTAVEKSAEELTDAVSKSVKNTVHSRLQRARRKRHGGSIGKETHKSDNTVEKATLNFFTDKQNAAHFLGMFKRKRKTEIVDQIKNAKPIDLFCVVVDSLNLQKTRSQLNSLIKLATVICESNNVIVSLFKKYSYKQERTKRSDDSNTLCLPFVKGKTDIHWERNDNMSYIEHAFGWIENSTVSDTICNYLNLIYIDTNKSEVELSGLLLAAGEEVCEIDFDCVDENKNNPNEHYSVFEPQVPEENGSGWQYRVAHDKNLPFSGIEPQLIETIENTTSQIASTSTVNSLSSSIVFLMLAYHFCTFSLIKVNK